MPPVAVYDEAGDPIGLCVEEAVGVAVYREGIAEFESPFYPASEPGLVHGFVATLRYAEGYLAARVIEGATEEDTFAVEDGDYVADLSAGLGDVGAEDPRVPGPGAGRTPVLENGARLHVVSNGSVSSFSLRRNEPCQYLRRRLNIPSEGERWLSA
jgi:hypothetical protein